MRRRIIGGRRINAGPGTGPYRAGPGGACVCPKCKHEERRGRGVPCTEKKCPKCGAKMIRKGVK